MQLSDAIRQRRARFPKTFNDQKIEQKTLEALFDAANWAPTHKRTEPWRFVVISGDVKNELEAVAVEKYHESVPQENWDTHKEKRIRNKILRSSHIVAIVLHRDLKERVPEWEEVAAVAMAVQNLWLTATAFDIAGYWSTPKWSADLGDFLELAENEKCLGFFYMGYSDVPIHDGLRGDWKEKVRWRNID